MTSLKAMQTRGLGLFSQTQIVKSVVFVLWNIGLQSSLCGSHGFVVPGFQSYGIFLFNV